MHRDHLFRKYRGWKLMGRVQYYVFSKTYPFSNPAPGIVSRGWAQHLFICTLISSSNQKIRFIVLILRSSRIERLVIGACILPWSLESFVFLFVAVWSLQLDLLSCCCHSAPFSAASVRAASEPFTFSSLVSRIQLYCVFIWQVFFLPFG